MRTTSIEDNRLALTSLVDRNIDLKLKTLSGRLGVARVDGDPDWDGSEIGSCHWVR